MSEENSNDKPYDPTPKKLEEARKKGEIARSTDLQTAAAYAALTAGLFAFGSGIIANAGSELMVLLDQAHDLSSLMLSPASVQAPFGPVLWQLSAALAPIFVFPAIAVLVVIFAQRAFLITPSKLQPKLSRISLIKNAQNKFGRSGLFEFLKSATKLTVYSILLAVFLNVYLPDIAVASLSEPGLILALMGKLVIAFMSVVVCISMVIGGIDAVFQHHEHIRKNRMSRKDLTDETKESEGDPHMKQERRTRAQAIAAAQMMADVPKADVIIVNPTHYAVALLWDRMPGSAPVCVAKGLDEVALKIREVATEHNVPIHSDPPTARALHASVEIGAEIEPAHYQAVAASIRFAEDMRARARQSVVS